MRVIRKRQRAVAQRSPLKKKDNFSCRHCFPDFSRAELEWLNHFRSRGRHSVDWRGVPFVQRREAAGRSESLFVGLPSVLHRSFDSDLWVRFSCDFVNMSVKQHMLRQRSPYDASAMKFQLFVCRLPNPPLTTPTTPPHTLSVRRYPFRLFFFVRFPTSANQRVPKKISQRVHVWVERSRSDRVGWSRGGSETAMLCGSLTWQHVAVSHCSCFFPGLFSELLNTMVFNLSQYLTIRN